MLRFGYMDRQRINDRFTVGKSVPTEQDLHQLALEKFRSVLDLRTADEGADVLGTEAERDRARHVEGLQYARVPVDPDQLDAELIDRVRDTAAALPGPVFVHCTGGVRSGALTLMHVAVEEGISGAEARRRAVELDLVPDGSPLLDQLERYVDARVRMRGATDQPVA